MSEVTCPYCQHEQEINHDDGYGYDEGSTHEQDCYECEKTFKFTTCISFDYEIFCNNEDHELFAPFPIDHPSYTRCSKCDYRSYK